MSEKLAPDDDLFRPNWIQLDSISKINDPMIDEGGTLGFAIRSIFGITLGLE